MEKRFDIAPTEDTNRDSSEPNCRIFRCPETGNALYLANVTGVDYYSAYLSEPYKGRVALAMYTICSFARKNTEATETERELNR